MSLSKALPLAFFAAVSIASAPAPADVLYSSIPNLDVASDGHIWPFDPCSEAHCSLVVDKFSLRKQEAFKLITSVEFAVESNYGVSDPFSDIGFNIWDDVNGAPGTALFSELTGTGEPGFSYKKTSFGTTIITLPVQLGLPVGNYWIGFISEDPLGIPGYSGGPGDLRTDGSPFPFSFAATGDSAGFAILGEPPGVPEASTWGMLLVGFAALSCVGLGRRVREAKITA
jgi:hypothetical protein